jgi:hypothetical protein
MPQSLSFTCPKCHRGMEVDCEGQDGLRHLTFYAVTCPCCHAMTDRMLPGDPVGDPRQTTVGPAKTNCP